MRLWHIGLCLAAALLAGCGEEGPPMGTVSGTVTIGGTPPAEPILVQFVNSEMGQGASARTEAGGRYELSHPLRVGTYTVYFQRIATEGGAISTSQEELKTVPSEYRSEEASPLKKQVKEGANAIDLEVPAT